MLKVVPREKRELTSFMEREKVPSGKKERKNEPQTTKGEFDDEDQNLNQEPKPSKWAYRMKHQIE